MRLSHGLRQPRCQRGAFLMCLSMHCNCCQACARAAVSRAQFPRTRRGLGPAAACWLQTPLQGSPTSSMSSNRQSMVDSC